MRSRRGGTPRRATAEDKKEKDLDKRFDQVLIELGRVRESEIFPLLLNRSSISASTVDDVFRDLRRRYPANGDHNRKQLDVILESSGGSIDAAYNIGLLLRRYGQEQLNIIIPRWAKSAATVIACCGDAIEMTYISELGPVDPQITMFNPLEKRLEEFSPLDIDSTLQLIRDEFRTGDERLARGLQERLQFPLTLGGIKKSLEVGKQYVERLLSSRMLKECPGDLSAAEVAQSLVHAYSTHSFCIDHDEASRIGLKVHPVPDNQIDMLWELRTISLQKEDIDKSRKEKLIRDAIKDLPREFLRDLSIPQRATVPGITAG